jgi:osmotically inducible protein OsmC
MLRKNYCFVFLPEDSNTFSACSAMAFALTLAENGTSPEQLRVAATCTLEEVEGKPKITHMDLDVSGRVAGLDAAGFAQAVQQAEQLCPVSGALRGNVEIRLTPHLVEV